MRRLLGGDGAAVALREELERLEAKAKTLLEELYGKLSPWQTAQVARHTDRSHSLDFINALVEDFTPLAGDPDLFLTLNSFAPPIVAASVRGAMAVDAISFGTAFCFPLFLPFLRVNAFSTTVFNISAYTFSIP